MANRTQAAPCASAHSFFSLNAHYFIAPDAKASDLALDAGCLLSVALSVLGGVIDGLQEHGSQMQADPIQMASMLHSVRYQLEMAASLVETIEVLS